MCSFASFARGRGPAYVTVLLVTGLAPVVAPVHAGARAPYPYVSPAPGSRLVSPGNNVVVRADGRLDAASVVAGRVAATGSRSGPHPGRLVVADDGRTLVFDPESAFEPGERVRVAVLPGMRTTDGRALPPLAFDFEVAPARPSGAPPGLAALAAELPPAPATPRRSGPGRPALRAQASDTLPPDYPSITLLDADHPDSGDVFVAPFDGNYLRERGHLALLDNRGVPLFYRSWPTLAWDFKRQPNGLLTFFTLPGTYIALDSSYTVVDSFKTGNGYTTDAHELQLLPNGHALLMAYDWEPVGMDTVVAGGDPNALVAGLIVQELDTAKNVVFQWRSWDHFAITDMDTCIGKLTDPQVDYVHGNAIAPDLDGNLLISSRHMNEITKIDRQTGDIVWRLGLNARHNQFTFPNDPRGFSHQHDIRRLPNGDLTLFDNGNCFDPLYSRAVEYRLDETNLTATRVWEYRGTPDVVSPFMGDVQRHPDGGTMIGWGGAAPDPKLTELHADGTKAYELGFGSPTTWSYRAYRFPWQTTALVAGPAALDFGAVGAGTAETLRVAVTNGLRTPLALDAVRITQPAFSVTTPLPLVLAAGATDSLTVQFAPTALGAAAGDVYVEAVSDTDLVACDLAVSGVGTGAGISIADVAAPEGNAGTTPFAFTVSLSAPLPDTVTVGYATVDSSATVADNDYLPVSGTLTIPPDSLTATVTVQVVGDAVPENDERFLVQLSSPVHAVLVRPQGTGTIQNDDGQLGTDDPAGAPTRYALHPPQPNPLRRQAVIRYDLPRRGEARLEIFDVRGRKLATLLDGVRAPGRYVATWPAAGWPAGVYYSCLSAPGFRESRAFVLLR